MKNPWQKKHLKYVVWPVVVGGHLVIMKILGDVISERNAANSRAETMSAMFGSLSSFVGEDRMNAWEQYIGDRTDPTMKDTITFVNPIDVVPEEVTDGEESSEKAGSEDQSSDRSEP